MKKGSFHFAVLISLTLFGVLPVRAAFEGYLPMPRAEFAKKRALKHLLFVPIPEDGPEGPTPLSGWRFPEVGVSGVTLKPVNQQGDYPQEWVFEGRDGSGRIWTVYTGGFYSAAGNAEIYQADLDRNGVQDLIVFVPNAGNGMAPTSRLEIITFERGGRPVLLETWGFYRASEKGVDDLLDLKKDGRAQLLTMKFSDGYWITDLYQVNDARWQRVSGRFGRLTYPALTRFTHRDNRRVVHTIKPGINPVVPDLSNVRAVNSMRYRLLDAENMRFEADDGSVLSAWDRSPVLVIDSPQERQIYSGSADEQRREAALRQLMQDKRTVWLYGSPQNSNGNEPFTLWAGQLDEALSCSAK
ncbi:hypothetical protein [Leminorella grimontii]|uniref:hypothetical protein n=1 Tax=Leminorella grimontii TaxID=82981 RepID=UPI00321F72AE